MFLSHAQTEDKPYNKCISCKHLGEKCDGPNFLAMDMKRLSEWCRLRKDYLHHTDAKWTNQYIADISDVSKSSVDNFIAGKVDDIRMSTVARLVRVLVNGSWGQYPCAMASGDAEIQYIDNPKLVDKLAAAEQRISELKSQIERLHTHEDYLHRENERKAQVIDQLMGMVKPGR